MNDFDPSIIDIAQPGVCDRCGLRGMLLKIPIRMQPGPMVDWDSKPFPSRTPMWEKIEKWCIGCAESRGGGA